MVEIMDESTKFKKYEKRKKTKDMSQIHHTLV